MSAVQTGSVTSALYCWCPSTMPPCSRCITHLLHDACCNMVQPRRARVSCCCSACARLRRTVVLLGLPGEQPVAPALLWLLHHEGCSGQAASGPPDWARVSEGMRAARRVAPGRPWVRELSSLACSCLTDRLSFTPHPPPCSSVLGYVQGLRSDLSPAVCPWGPTRRRRAGLQPRLEHAAYKRVGSPSAWVTAAPDFLIWDRDLLEGSTGET